MDENNFGWAVECMRNGGNARRISWTHGKLINYRPSRERENKDKNPVPAKIMANLDGKVFPWVPNADDIFATDWSAAP